MVKEPAFRSAAFWDIPTPDFADVQIIPLPEGAPADPARWAGSIFSLRSAPWPVKVLLGIRVVLAPLIGIPKSESGIFDVQRVIGEEALIAVDDRHLDFRAGVGVDPDSKLVRVTTVVRFNGWRGRVYFVPVSVLHGPVTRAMMTRASRRLAGS
jgi:hypothetical protein